MFCSLCPRKCFVERSETTGKGYCRCGTLPVIARAAAHFWEEPCISGARGSGTIFFSGCSLGCVFCQNERISHHPEGKTLSPAALAVLFQRMEETGVHNLNLVTGTHFAPAIMEALSIRKPGIPVVWNSSGYETVEMVRQLANYIDIFLPDFKYADAETATQLAKASDYYETALSAIQAMCEATGSPVYDDEGMLLRGTVVRHLILPMRSGESIRILDAVKEKLPEGTPVSLMRQYTPMGNLDFPGLNRKITAREYNRVVEHMLQLNLPGFLQQKQAATSAYIPHFLDENSFSLLKDL